MKDFFTTYLDYVNIDKSEAPAVFHRWTILSVIGAALGRNCYFPFGHSKIYPNQYVMLMGSPGTRKSSALGIGNAALKETGYNRFSASKTSKERFIMDMKQTDDLTDIEQIEVLTLSEPSESYISIGEFTDFIGQGNMEFITMLTNLWDNLPEYENPKIHGKSVRVHEPCVNIIGGNTPQGFTLAFPPEALGNGFLSRLLFIYGEPSGKKITFPARPDPLQAAFVVNQLAEIRKTIRGEFTMSEEAQEVIDRIYKEAVDVNDHRFIHYASRRLTHLIKLCMIVAASDLRMHIEIEDTIKANTMLAGAEKNMPKALGEFGKSKYSDISNTVMDILNHSKRPLSANDIFKKVSQDIPQLSALIDVMKNLEHAHKVKVMTIAGKAGYVAHHEPVKEWHPDLVYKEYLTAEERM